MHLGVCKKSNFPFKYMDLNRATALGDWCLQTAVTLKLLCCWGVFIGFSVMDLDTETSPYKWSVLSSTSRERAEHKPTLSKQLHFLEAAAFNWVMPRDMWALLTQAVFNGVWLTDSRNPGSFSPHLSPSGRSREGGKALVTGCKAH